MAKARKLPSGNWNVKARVKIDGKLVTRSFTGTNRVKVEYEAQQWQEECRIVNDCPENMTVKQMINKYIELNSNVLSPSTIRGYRKIYNHNLKDLMDVRIYQLNNLIIQSSINNALKKYSAKTIKNQYGLLNNSLRVYYPSYIWSVKYPQSPKKHKKYYSNEFILSLIGAVKDTRIEAEVLLGISSMRASEVAGAKWTDIDWENRRLYVNRVKVMNDKNEFVVKNKCKTVDSQRSVYLPKYTIQRLLIIKEKSNSEFISQFKPDRYWKMLNQVLKDNNLEKISFHELRHIYSSITDYLGFDTELRMEDGGWSNETIMNGSYRHAITDNQIKSYKRFDDYLSELA